MSRYRQSFNEALQLVEKWDKDVEIKSTGDHAGKTIDQLKREVDALRGKPNNEKEMGGLLFAIRAKQGWKKGEGSTGVEESTQTTEEHDCDEVHPDVSHEDWEVQKDEALDTWHPDPEKDRKSTSMKHTAKAVAHHDAQKKKPAIDTRQAAKKIQDILKKQRERRAAAAQSEGNLPPHLSKFLDKKGNPNPEAAKRMADGQKKRAIATKVKDVTPKGYGPTESKEDIPKGFHKMPDGTIMKDSEHKKEKTKKEDTEWAKSKKQDREAQKRSEKQHDEREARYQRQKAAAGSVKEDLEFKVTIKGIPPFYVPAKTAAAVKQSLRKQLKHPDDIESIIRVTKSAQKIDYRKRAQGKSSEDDNKK